MLLEYLSNIFDPRRKQGQLYDLPHVLLFSILAIQCYASSYRKIQRFIYGHRVLLNKVFDLNWELAKAHTSIRYIIQGLNTDDVEQIFRQYSNALSGDEEPSKGRLYVAIDGKQLRGSFDHFEGRRAAHLISAFCQGEQLILGHLETDEKSNEIPSFRY